MMNLKQLYRNNWQGYRGFKQDIGSGDRAAIVPQLEFEANGKRSVSRVVRSVRRKCRGGTSVRQTVVAVSREKEADRLDPYASSRSKLLIAVFVGIVVFICQLVDSYLRAVCRCATCVMGMMGMFKWLRNESYRNALQAFIDRRRFSDDVETEAPTSPDKKRVDLLTKTNNNKYDNERKLYEPISLIPGVPHIPPSEIFEIGWVAGTEDRYLELIFAEWQNTRVSLKRHSHPECRDAVKADLDVLSEIRHPNVLLLMASTYTDDHGLVSIFESIDCTLYHYLHDQGERISIQGIARCGGRLSDALRHSHMRGYVHTAINSHCVYLASNGIVKLGGWELAMHVNSPKQDREYEERLRTEIFRWQAPELFHSYEPRKESDIYGLTLLIWEMCTMRVPWSGYSKADVERQYVHWKRGVAMDLYDFPPLLNNLLEAGLQLDANKRTLDMNRMRRFLQRLEMQYEDEEPVYIDQYANNNNDTGKTFVLPVTRSPSVISRNKSSKVTRSISAKIPESPTKQYLYQKRSKQNGNVKATTHIEQVNFFGEDVKPIAKENLQKNMNMLCATQNNYKKHNYSNCNLEASDIGPNDEANSEETSQPWSSTYKRVKGPQETVESRTTSVYSSPLLDSTDDESFKDARTNLKQLKKVLANRREHFFYGSDSSHTSAETSLNDKNRILDETKSKSYEPHKPASHKTSFEPKYNKCPNQYDSTYIKSSSQQCRKTPYMHTPESIKDAIIQPKVLNSDPQSFFETSLWRKEKLICLSKMRKSYSDESPQYPAQHADDNETVSTETFTIPRTSESIFSVQGDNTYVVNNKLEASTTENDQEKSTQISENASDSAEISNTHNQIESLQVLKDALDRATKIVRPVTPNTDDSCTSLPFKSYQEFEVEVDNGQTCKSMFEELYDLHTNKDNEEIKIIERSTTNNVSFLLNENIFSSNIDSNVDQNKSENEITVNIISHEKPSYSYDASYGRSFICESIAEVSSEFNSSCNDIKSSKLTESSNDQITNVEEDNSLETVQSTAVTIDISDVDAQIEIKENEKKSTENFDLMFLNDTPKNKNCKSCHRNALPRRRSLPAALSQLRSMNNSALGKLPIRRGDVPDNTIEDLYIDDEFGDSLNVNMVLLDEDLSVDEDFLLKMTEL
ncbi:uncharacterized protein LOC100880685 isoform X2 [Megachile rotundata]|uniref:uncharacterized protein LOC100880685 isoform X2 n=1 Tax=Megachile rotundata TaxID=143995 RepID=UPI003FD5E22D